MSDSEDNNTYRVSYRNKSDIFFAEKNMHNLYSEEPSLTYDDLKEVVNKETQDTKIRQKEISDKLEKLEQKMSAKEKLKQEKFDTLCMFARDFLKAGFDKDLNGEIDGNKMNDLFYDYLVACKFTTNSHIYRKVFEACGLVYDRPGGKTKYKGYKLKPTVTKIIDFPTVPTFNPSIVGKIAI
jgi:hypothetical protein